MYIKAGSTDVHLYMFFQDSVTGAGYTTTGAETAFNINFIQHDDATETTSAASQGTLATHGDNTITHVGRGIWQVDLPDAAWDNTDGDEDRVTVIVDHDTTLILPSILHIDLDGPHEALVDVNLDHLMKTAVSGAASPTFSEVTDRSLLSWVMTKTGDSSDFVASTDSLEALQAAATGTGAVTWVYTVYKTNGSTALEGAEVWASTADPATDANTVAYGVTDSSGQVTFYLDANDYYFWVKKGGYTFDLPDTETVA